MRSAFLDTGVIRFCRSSQQSVRLRAVLALLLGLGVMNIYPSAHAQTLLDNIVEVAAGENHTCALTSTGGVKCWGGNSEGQLGDGTTINRLTPVNVSGLTSGVSAITAGFSHTCALMTSGGTKCWGSNWVGQLGDGTANNRLTPVDVSGLTSGASAIAAGWRHTCALTAGGGVKCWGSNFDGELGNGSTTSQPTPVNVSGLTSGVSAITAGFSHTCALTTGGGAKCWGDNWQGKLGDGTTTNRLTPVDVSGLTSGTVAVTAGADHTCAVTTGGGVKCWGANGGQLGDGTITNRLTPVDVSGLSSGVSAITAGSSHTCAVTSAGSAKCWGNNSFGQIGDGTATLHLTPVDVSGLTSGVSAINAGSGHTCAIVPGGRLKCWGGNLSGQLGDGTSAQRATPTEVDGSSSGLSTIDAGDTHSCAISSQGGAKCWGRNFAGEIGDGTTTLRLSPVDVSDFPDSVAANTTVSGEGHNCALTTGGGVKCWGWNAFGQLGDGSTTQRNTPVDVIGLASRVSAIAAGQAHTCAVTISGGVKCWGRNEGGQLGDGSTTQRNTPVDVIGLASGVSAIAAGGTHTCAVATSGVKCWGSNEVGQLGDGTNTQRLKPVAVSGLTSGVAAIAAGLGHTCALRIGGDAECWGHNFSGQLGDGTGIGRLTPVDVSSLSGQIIAIVAGGLHTCAITIGGGLKCWGMNFDGQLGDGTGISRLAPVGVSGLSVGVARIAAGDSHTCAITTDGNVKCWGRNQAGQLGDGTNTTPRRTPVEVIGLSTGVSAISAGERHTCGITSAGATKCWGGNWLGQIGDGSTTERLTPTGVIGFSAAVSSISAGGAHSCALTSSGGVKCWGWNVRGELGDGTLSPRFTPVDVSGLTSGVRAISTGRTHTCALTTNGGIKCWGQNDRGQLGDGTTTTRLVPVDVNGLTGGVTAIAAGTSHTCALTSVGGVKCWGINFDGQLGDGTTVQRLAPVDVNGLSSGISAIVTGSSHTCALTNVGGVKCWGYNAFGQLGEGTLAQTRLTPTDVVGLSGGVSVITAGSNHTCAVSSGGGVKCWGQNEYGQLGDSTNNERRTPVDVFGLLSGATEITAGGQHTCALFSGGGTKCWGSHLFGQLGVGGRNYALPGDVLATDGIYADGFESAP